MKTCLTLLCVFLFLTAAGQQKKKNYFPLWTFHQRNSNIHGVSVGLGTVRSTPRFTNTNGLKLEVPGVGLLVLLIPESPIAQDDSSFQFRLTDTISERINGISLSALGTVCDCIVNGVSIGLVGQIQHQVNGLSFTFFSFTQVHNGVQLGLRNETYKMRGLQIGLFNHSKATRGFQIGLWNRNERRTLPLLNWNFRRREA